MKTKTAVLYESSKPLVIEELEIPELKEGNVLVKVHFSGLCHSQINEIKALKGEDKYLPHTLGHEASASVEKVGPGVTKVKGGDYVVVSWIKGSGLDSFGIHYLKDGKKINAGSAATFTQYAIVAENRLTKIPEEVPKDVAALLGCAIPTGGGIIINELNPKKGDTLAIFGIGGIGAGALAIASSVDVFSKIIAVDINDLKLELAKDLGATHTINANTEDVVEKIKSLTENKGVDYSIESAGSKKAMETAFSVIKEGVGGKDGGLTVIAGNISDNERIEIYPFDLIKGKRIKGTWGGSTNPDKDLLYYSQKYLEGKINLKKFISKTYSLEDINVALRDLEQGKILRALIDFSK